MSTSNRSKRPDALLLGRRHRVAGAAAGAAVALMILWGSAAQPDELQLRVVASGESLTVQIVDGPNRILIANASSPTEARAALGALNRPWEAKPSVIVSDSRDLLANGLWETLQRTPAEQLVVLGAPGNSEDWSRIERYCRDEGIDLQYLDRQVTLQLETMTLSLIPGLSSGSSFPDSYAMVSTGSMRVAIELGGLPASGRYHVVLATSPLPAALESDLVMGLIPGNSAGGPGRQIHIEEGRRAVLALEPERIRVRGGTLADHPED